MSDTPERSLPDLLTSLASDVTGLFRKEVQLAKAEASEKLDHAISASRGLVIGLVLGIGAVGIFLAALVSGLAWLLLSFGMSPVAADFVSPLAIAVITGAIAWSFINRGIDAWKASRLSLDRTAHSLSRDAEVVKESF